MPGLRGVKHGQYGESISLFLCIKFVLVIWSDAGDTILLALSWKRYRGARKEKAWGEKTDSHQDGGLWYDIIAYGYVGCIGRIDTILIPCNYVRIPIFPTLFFLNDDYGKVCLQSCIIVLEGGE